MSTNLQGVVVTATNTVTNVATTLISDANGIVNFTNLSAGQYSISAIKTGYEIKIGDIENLISDPNSGNDDLSEIPFIVDVAENVTSTMIIVFQPAGASNPSLINILVEHIKDNFDYYLRFTATPDPVINFSASLQYSFTNTEINDQMFGPAGVGNMEFTNPATQFLSTVVNSPKILTSMVGEELIVELVSSTSNCTYQVESGAEPVEITDHSVTVTVPAIIV